MYDNGQDYLMGKRVITKESINDILAKLDDIKYFIMNTSVSNKMDVYRKCCQIEAELF